MKKLNRLALTCAFALLAGPAVAAADAVSDWNEIAVAATGAGRPGAIGQTDMALTRVAMHDALQCYEARFEPFYAQFEPAGSKVAAAVAAVHGVLVVPIPLAGRDPGCDLCHLLGQQRIDLTLDWPWARGSLPRSGRYVFGTQPTAASEGRRKRRRQMAPDSESPRTSAAAASGAVRVSVDGQFSSLRADWPGSIQGPAAAERTSDRYAAAYNEVKAKGASTGSTRTPEQTDLAYFWLDNFGVHNRAMRELAATHVPRIGYVPGSMRSRISPGRMRSSPHGTARSITTSGVL